MICRVYIYICTNLNGGTPFFGPPLPPNARLKQPGWPCPSVRPCNGFKPLKWATEVAGPRVPRGQRLPTWKYVIMCLWETILVVGYWNDTPRIIFSFGYVFFLGGGGLNGDDTKYGTQISLVPGRLGGRFLSGWHPSLRNLRCIRSLAMSWMRRWNMWWPWFRLTFPYERWDMMVMLQEGFLWVTWVTWVTWVFEA